jgi:drug/metabolite transporter (DMT)-like permease
VVFGLASAIAWGAGDFGGGLTSRRAPVFGVVFISQIVGMALAFSLAMLLGETLFTGADLAWSVAGGIAGGIGITSLYRALSIGRMAVVAPVTAVLAAMIPVGVGFVTQGLPNQVVIGGIALAIIAVVLVSRVEDESDGRSAGLGLAVVAGVGFGLFGACIGQLTDGHVFGPLTVVRATEAVLLIGVIVVTRSGWRPPRDLVLAICAVGVLDMAGNGAYILSAQAGSLAVAAVLSSLYPVTTVVLATVVLHERITRAHAVGILLAATAVTMISIGSA